MTQKHKLSTIWSYSAVFLKKLHNNNEFLVRFWEFIRSGLTDSNHPPQKEILNYITSRNMRRTLLPSDFIKFSKSIGSVFLNFQKSKKYYMYPLSVKILKFHSKTALLGNLVSKQYTKRETQEELELSFGGPEISRLIIFIKNFDETLEKNPEMLVFFSAYWCQHCQRLRKPFGLAALMAKEANLPISFATFDITTDPELAIEKGIVGIPLIRYYKQGKLVSTYRGKRTAEDLFEYVKNPPQPGPDNTKSDI